MAAATGTSEQAAPMVAPAEDAGGRCANCAAGLTGPYCAACGQSAEDIKRPLFSLIEQLLETMAHFDARGLRSIRLLLTAPGRLTAEYLAGRRASQVPPFRLYIVISLGFFLTLSGAKVALLQLAPITLNSTDAFAALQLSNNQASLATTVDRSATAFAPLFLEPLGQVAAGPRVETSVEIGGVDFAEKLNHAMADPALLNARITDVLPKLLFILVPLFALLLKALYLRRRRYFIEHLIFAVHLHAAAFLLLIFGVALIALRAGQGVIAVIGAAGLAYLVVALRRVYRQDYARTVAKAACVLAGYGVALILSLFPLLFLSLRDL